eukprot:721268-Rhodomonas_salina.2
MASGQEVVCWRVGKENSEVVEVDTKWERQKRQPAWLEGAEVGWSGSGAKKGTKTPGTLSEEQGSLCVAGGRKWVVVLI